MYLYSNTQQRFYKNILITGITSIHGFPIFTYFADRFPSAVQGVRGLYSIYKDPAYKNSSSKNPANQVHQIEMANEKELSALIKHCNPDLIIHCFGMCDLDGAEKNPDRAKRLNCATTQYLCNAAPKSKIVYISYDLVFSGKHPPKSGYHPKDMPDPVSVVGKTIVETEHIIRTHPNHLIVRLGLPMGPSVQGDKGAYDYIAYRIKHQLMMTLFTDEIRSVPRTSDLGPALERLIHEDCQGMFHLGSVQKRSLYQIGIRIAEELGIKNHSLIPTTTAEAPACPPRIQDVSLDSWDTFSVLGYTIPGW